MEAFEGKLIVFGSINQNGIQNQVYSYDRSLDKWTEEEPLPQKRAFFDSVQWGGRIFLMGGSDGNKDLNLVESFVPSSLSVSDGSFRLEIELPEPPVDCKAEQLADTLFVICRSKVMKLSPNRTNWVTENNPKGFALDPGFTLAYYNNNLYIMGGNNASGESESIFVRFQALYSIMLPLLTKD